ncbi:hypothetical protein [Lentilactobacillus otakiensis]|uniref:hypothetical protein n=1 Tax=Lentilactobacillus otakiensis TaxID=481720 RepID=UPI003D16F9A3
MNNSNGEEATDNKGNSMKRQQNISRPTQPNVPHHKWKKMYTKNRRSPGHIIKDGYTFAITETQKYIGIPISRKYPLKVVPAGAFSRNVNKFAKYWTGYHILNFKMTRYMDIDSGAIYYKDKFVLYNNRKYQHIIGVANYYSYRTYTT